MREMERDVYMTIGHVTYEIRTLLSDGELDRVRKVIAEASNSVIPAKSSLKGLAQDKLLLLLCLGLAYDLDVVSEGMKTLLARMEEES